MANFLSILIEVLAKLLETYLGKLIVNFVHYGSNATFLFELLIDRFTIENVFDMSWATGRCSQVSNHMMT